MLSVVRHRGVTIALSLALAASMVAMATPAAEADSGTGVFSVRMTAPGPHSPQGRSLAKTTITRTEGVVVRSVDLGDAEFGRKKGQYRAPVRGILVTPEQQAEMPAKLIVVTHLRYPNCAGDRFAYPCPRGKRERRLDRGMTHIGVELSRRGYSVLIPDLGPLYIGDDLTSPYDQPAGVRKVVGRLIDTAVSASAGKKTRMGSGLRGSIDASQVGLLAHSRSATLAGDLTRGWSSSAHPIASLMTYGGGYDAYYGGAPDSTPMVPDVPYLGVVGDQDQDTPYLSAMWLTRHVDSRRSRPALVAVAPGFGHTFVNRILSSAKIDDRICEVGCRTASEHEKFLGRTAHSWFGATLRQRPTRLPLRPTGRLPKALSGVPVHWLAVTNRDRANVFLAGRRGTLQPFGVGARARSCFPAEPMAPSMPGTCPMSFLGVSMNAEKITQVALTPSSGVRLRTAPTMRVAGVALHLAPSGDRRDHAPGSPLRVTVGLSNGRRVVLDVSPSHAALVNRETKDVNGTYSIGTVRLRLPRWVRDTQVVSVKLTGGTAKSRFDVRAIDLAQTRNRTHR